MSPLIAAPARGYADYQRIENYDTGVIVNLAAAGSTGVVISGIVDVSRFEYLAGLVTMNVGFCTITATWFADAAGSIVMGTSQFVVSSTILRPMQLRLPNLGPFVQVQMGAIAGGNYTGTVQLIGTNRYNALPAVPVDQMVMNTPNTAVAPSNTATFNPSDYYAGPATAWISTTGAFSLIDFQSVDTNGAGQIFYSLATAAASTQQFPLTMPMGWWLVQAKNVTAGNQSIQINVTPSMTGSN